MMIINILTLVILVFFISIITTIGGVGGGGLLIPCYILIGGFSLEQAVPLSIITIFGDTLVRFVALVFKKHPYNSKRFLVDITPVLILVPFDGLTSFVGVILSQITPDVLRTLCIIVTLGITFIKSTKKALTSYMKENEYLNSDGLKMIMIDGIAEYVPINQIQDIAQTDLESNTIHIGDTTETLLQNMGILTLIMSIIATFTATRDNLLEKCSLSFGFQLAGQSILLCACGISTCYYVMNSYVNKKNLNTYLFLEGDIKWSIKNTIKFALIGSCTGFLSTYMGIGGGMLTTPVMIQAGMIPEVVVGTSSVTTFFSTIISIFNYAFSGSVPWVEGIIFAVDSAVGSAVGLYLSKKILEKYKRQSFIIFIVSMIVFTSTVLLCVNAFTRPITFKFPNYCTTK